MAEGPNGLDVLVDESVANGTSDRQRQLRTQHPGAVAVTYDKFVNQITAAERKELVADAPLVYIYHDTIDAMGDRQSTESKTFKACRDAIQELKALVERLVREQKASNILITADHGFLYTAEPLEEHESAGICHIEGDTVEYGRRYAVARAGAASHTFVTAALPSDELVGFFPRECVRIKLAGGRGQLCPRWLYAAGMLRPGAALLGQAQGRARLRGNCTGHHLAHHRARHHHQRHVQHRRAPKRPGERHHGACHLRGVRGRRRVRARDQHLHRRRRPRR